MPRGRSSTSQGAGVPPPHPLDCSRAAAFLLWFCVGSLLAGVALGAGVQKMGNRASLLRVGTANPWFGRVQAELGPLAAGDAVGHDGQFFYLIARDPGGVRGTPEVIAHFDNNGPRYRYRRILYPLAAGGLGQFGSRATLVNMMVLVIVGMGLTAVALADIGFQLKVAGEVVLAALANPGALVAAMFLLPDPMALGFALGAVALSLRRRWRWAHVACLLAALTRETYLLVALALACWHWREGRRSTAWASVFVPLLPLSGWSLWLSAVFTDGPAVTRNIGVPFEGFLRATGYWLQHERDVGELVLAVCACLMCVAAATAVVRRRPAMLRLLAAPWILLGGVASLHVWGQPNNAARALAILWPLAALMLAGTRSGGGAAVAPVSIFPGTDR